MTSRQFLKGDPSSEKKERLATEGELIAYVTEATNATDGNFSRIRQGILRIGLALTEEGKEVGDEEVNEGSGIRGGASAEAAGIGRLEATF